MNLMKRKQGIESRLAEIRGLADKETDMEKLSTMKKRMRFITRGTFWY